VRIGQRVGELLWVGFEEKSLPASLEGRLRAGEVGGVVLFTRNLGTVEENRALVAALRAAAPEVLLQIDQEGGRVQRIKAPATVWPPMRRLGELWEREPARAEALARAVGGALGAELAALDLDVDFAPVLDVDTNPLNPVIGDRAFARDAEAVARLGGAFAAGLDASGILACGKHFPGHGDTAVDSHLALPRLDHSLARLRAVELVPFARVRTPLVMTAHVVFAALDPDLPATLSPAVLGGLLRGELGYDGVVVSDDLEMKAVADHWGVGDAVVRGLLAGCDAFLLCRREELQIEAFEALVRAAERDAAVRARVDEAAARVTALKARHFARRGPTTKTPLAVLGSAEHRALAADMAYA
jgi:beta-N-acetylhexosaminidase